MAEGTAHEVLSGAARWSVFHGDCLELLRSLPDNSIDSIVTDPPSGIAFMNRAWDRDKGGRDKWIAWLAEIMTEALRVLKPGAHALVWALPRTSGWTSMALEDAGFEIRDSLHHMFGSGFPKSLAADKAIDAKLGANRPVVGVRNDGAWSPGHLHALNASPGEYAATDAAKEWRGWGTACKPSHEVWWLARKPLDGTLAENLMSWGVGGLNVDASRIRFANDNDMAAAAAAAAAQRLCHDVPGQVMKHLGETGFKNPKASLAPYLDGMDKGRWPPNALFTHSAECKKTGTTEVPANPTWDTPNRQTEPSAFTGSDVSKVRHANGRDGEPSADRRYTDKGSTNFAPTPGARRDDTESVDVWECVSAGSATVPTFGWRMREQGPSSALEIPDLLRLVLLHIRANGTGGIGRARDASAASHNGHKFAAAPESLDGAARALGLAAIPGFLSGCPSCRGSGDEHVRRIVAAARDGLPSLTDALARVSRLVEAHEHIPQNPASDRPESSGGSHVGCEPGCTQDHRSGGARRTSASSESPRRNGRKSRAAQPPNEQPTDNLGNSTGAPVDSHATASRNEHTADCIQTLSLVALELASAFVPELVKGESTISWGSCPVRELARQSGTNVAGVGVGVGVGGIWSPSCGKPAGNQHGDSGSAARYFPQFEWTELDDVTPFLYCAKPSRGEVEAGLENFRPRTAGEATDRTDETDGLNSPRAGAGRTGGVRNVHPTKKSVELMRWLARLITPPGGLVLDCFAGSGATGVACLCEGFRFAGAELNDTDDEPFASIARARLHHVEGRSFTPRESLRAKEPPRQQALFSTRDGAE